MIMLILFLMMLTATILGAAVASANYEAPLLPKYIREMDAIKQWGISKASFIRARKKGLPFVRLGAYVCYRPEDLESYFCNSRSWQVTTPNGREL